MNHLKVYYLIKEIPLHVQKKTWVTLKKNSFCFLDCYVLVQVLIIYKKLIIDFCALRQDLN